MKQKTVDDALDMGYMFIKYRDYMFSLTKETKYRLLTSKSVADFIDVIYSDFKDIDLVVLFDKMEAKGWASLQKRKRVENIMEFTKQKNRFSTSKTYSL